MRILIFLAILISCYSSYAYEPYEYLGSSRREIKNTYKNKKTTEKVVRRNTRDLKNFKKSLERKPEMVIYLVGGTSVINENNWTLTGLGFMSRKKNTFYGFEYLGYKDEEKIRTFNFQYGYSFNVHMKPFLSLMAGYSHSSIKHDLKDVNGVSFGIKGGLRLIDTKYLILEMSYSKQKMRGEKTFSSDNLMLMTGFKF